MSNLDDLLERLREKSERARDTIDSLPPDVRAGVDQHVCDDEDAIRAIERLRAALKNIRDEIVYGGGDIVDGPDIDKLHDIARKALKGET